jgi:hypothetical protein
MKPETRSQVRPESSIEGLQVPRREEEASRLDTEPEIRERLDTVMASQSPLGQAMKTVRKVSR